MPDHEYGPNYPGSVNFTNISAGSATELPKPDQNNQMKIFPWTSSWAQLPNLQGNTAAVAHSILPGADEEEETNSVIATGFGFDVEGETVAGIEVFIKCSANSPTTSDDVIVCHLLRLRKGLLESVNRACNENNYIKGNLAVHCAAGSDSDNWNDFVTPQEVEGPDFGVVFAFSSFENEDQHPFTIEVQKIGVKVYTND